MKIQKHGNCSARWWRKFSHPHQNEHVSVPNYPFNNMWWLGTRSPPPSSQKFPHFSHKPISYLSKSNKPTSTRTHLWSPLPILNLPRSSFFSPWVSFWNLRKSNLCLWLSVMMWVKRRWERKFSLALHLHWSVFHSQFPSFLFLFLACFVVYL